MAKCMGFFKIFALALVGVTVLGDAGAATNVARRVSVSRGKVASRTPVVKNTVETPAVTETESEPEEVVEEPAVFEFENRSDQFDAAINSVSSGDDSGVSVFAQHVRRSKAADAAEEVTNKNKAKTAAMLTGENACDKGLRECMVAKCGTNFSDCAGNSDTTWGNKIESCRHNVKCSSTEYTVFAIQIKADRDFYAGLANFNGIIDCGKKYNACIIKECGTTFSDCLGKKQGDAAIAKCKSIQTQCVQKDNGLASRMMNVFAGMRQNAEVQVQRDEQRLYDLRTEMENVCKHSGAMFDQRSLDCVYTVNFFANAEEKPYASKKAYAGSVFSCDPGWFGIDVTTFKENAYRLTRSQTAASSAMLGAGVGVGVGAITSGAIDRAVKTQKAKKELKAAKKDAEDLRAESEAANGDITETETPVEEAEQTE